MGIDGGWAALGEASGVRGNLEALGRDRGWRADQSSPPLGSALIHLLRDMLKGSVLESDLPDLS